MDSQNYGRPIFGKNTGTASSQPAATATAAKHAAPASTIAKYKYQPKQITRPKPWLKNHMATTAINPNSILQSFNSKPILVLAATITMMWHIFLLEIESFNS